MTSRANERARSPIAPFLQVRPLRNAAFCCLQAAETIASAEPRLASPPQISAILHYRRFLDRTISSHPTGPRRDCGDGADMVRIDPIHQRIDVAK